VPDPVPLAPPVTESHDVSLVAVQAHADDGSVTATLPLAAPSPTLAVVGDKVALHVVGAAAPLCVRLKVSSAMVRVPVRLLSAVLAATL